MDVDHPNRSRFEAWLMESPAHQQAYADIEKVWHKLDSGAEVSRLTAILNDQSRNKRNNLIKSATKVISFVFVSLIGFYGYHTWENQSVMQVTTVARIGEIKTEHLQDGSKITLNAKGDMEVVYYRNKRVAKLKNGEAIFEVAPDESRPFIVDSGMAKITVLGTRFAVNKLGTLVRVSVDYGRVRVETQNAEGDVIGDSVVLTNSQVAEISNTSSPIKMDRNAADAFSFGQGVISFNKAELPEIAETLNRYRTKPVELNAVSSIHSRISARVSSKNVEAFLDRLPLVVPVSINHETDKTVISKQAEK
jgi:transmembrane sensor